MSFPAPFYRWRPHPWHGLEVGPTPPHRVSAYIEITPFDPIKYELDKINYHPHSGGFEVTPRGGCSVKTSPKGDHQKNPSQADSCGSLIEKAERFGTGIEGPFIVAKVS